jgi:hypothetical protein
MNGQKHKLSADTFYKWQCGPLSYCVLDFGAKVAVVNWIKTRCVRDLQRLRHFLFAQ